MCKRNAFYATPMCKRHAMYATHIRKRHECIRRTGGETILRLEVQHLCGRGIGG